MEFKPGQGDLTDRARAAAEGEAPGLSVRHFPVEAPGREETSEGLAKVTQGSG